MTHLLIFNSKIQNLLSISLLFSLMLFMLFFFVFCCFVRISVIRTLMAGVILFLNLIIIFLNYCRTQLYLEIHILIVFWPFFCNIFLIIFFFVNLVSFLIKFKQYKQNEEALCFVYQKLASILFLLPTIIFLSIVILNLCVD